MANRHIQAFWGLAVFAAVVAASHALASPYAPLGQDAADSGGDASACPDDAPFAAAKALHFAGDADFWREDLHTACRLDPDHTDRAIVALSYFRGEEQTGKPHKGDDTYQRDLDLVVLDLSSDKVLAHRHEDKALSDGGERLKGISIDTGRYILAMGKRAFGVRVSNDTNCSCKNMSQTSLTLYLRNGSRLDRLMTTSVHTWQAGYEKDTPPPPACTSVATDATTTVVVDKSKSHGLADLQLVTIEKPSYDFDDDPSQCPKLSASKRRSTFRYDGDIYK